MAQYALEGEYLFTIGVKDHYWFFKAKFRASRAVIALANIAAYCDDCRLR